MHCSRCDLDHDVMGPCPEARTPLDLLVGWFRGERSFDSYLIVAAVVIVLAIALAELLR